MKRSPAASSWRGRGAAPCDLGADRSVLIRPSMNHETAYDTASTANGSHRVTAYSSPPIGAPTSDATCWRAWCCESAVGSSSVATTERTAEISAGANSPAPRAGEHGHREEVRQRQRTGQRGDDERGVEEYAGRAGQPHQPPPVEPVGQHPGRQQGRRQAEQVSRLRERCHERRAGELEGEQREDEHAHPAAELADRRPRPEHREVVVAREPSEPGHIRTIYCARVLAQ